MNDTLLRNRMCVTVSAAFNDLSACVSTDKDLLQVVLLFFQQILLAPTVCMPWCHGCHRHNSKYSFVSVLLMWHGADAAWI